jgi:Actinobacteria/chloroflexi VLRF1 release factor
VTVPAQRLLGWVRGFGERHGAVTARTVPLGFELQAADGALAQVSAASGAVPFPGWPEADDVPPDPKALAEVVAAHLLTERDVALLVVRRGGYAAARLHGGAIVASKVGSRYVQGRTAAGGWSQHRFARRRDNQTTGLLGAATQVAARILGDGPVQALVTGGDRALIDRMLADPALRAVAALPRGPHLALGDPRADVVRAVPDLLRSVRITLTEPPPSTAPDGR